MLKTDVCFPSESVQPSPHSFIVQCVMAHMGHKMTLNMDTTRELPWIHTMTASAIKLSREWMLICVILGACASRTVYASRHNVVEIKSNKLTGPYSVDDRTLSETPERYRRSLFSLEYEQTLIDQHNDLRRVEPASDMEYMTRHGELTRMAEDWAKLCIWEHGQPERANPPFEYIGQNLYAYNGTFNATRGVQLWFDEYVFYDYNTGGCSQDPCGHYTQMVWSNSRRLGCAYAYCSSMAKVDLINAHYLVCNYGPGGNYVGQKPYKKGPMCTQCKTGRFYCNNGLCDRGCSRQSTTCECKAWCQNCGTTVSSNCSCTCAAGWHGPNCAEPCQDTHENCGANPGWPKYFCDTEPYVRDQCPALCDLCQVRRGPPVTCSATTRPPTEPRMTVPTHPPEGTQSGEVELIPHDSGTDSLHISICVKVLILAELLLHFSC